MLLAFSPVGPEFRIHAATLESQSDPAIAIDGDGDFVVAYVSQDGPSDTNIYARRFNSQGVAQGTEFRVNSFTLDSQLSPAVAMDADGDFIVVWESHNQDGNSSGIYAQRYNAAGVAQGTEFRVNSHISGAQAAPSVTMSPEGNFVIAWHSQDAGGNGSIIYAQRFDATGARRGLAIEVSNNTANVQQLPAVSMDGSGNFVVAWQSAQVDGSGDGVVARRYRASGAPLSNVFIVNSTLTGFQGTPSVTMGSGGEFVITWRSDGQDGSAGGIYAQRYNVDGVAQGGEFRANTTTANNQGSPSVMISASLDFVIAWHSASQDGSGDGIYAQRYDASGVAQGSEFRVNTHTTNNQSLPAVALERDGDLVITWQSELQDGSGSGIYAQRYDETTDTAGPMLSGFFTNGTPAVSYSIQRSPISQVTVSFSEDVMNSGPGGANSVTNPANWRAVLDLNGTFSSVGISSITYQFNAATNRFQATLNLSDSYAAGTLQIAATGSIRDAAGNGLVNRQNGVMNGDSISFGIDSFAARGEFRVNTHTPNGQHDAAVAIDSVGNYVVVWTSEGQDSSDSGIYAQRYSASGVAIGGEFRVNAVTADTQFAPAVALDESGDFVIVWTSYGQDGWDSAIYARRYGPAGTPLGNEFRVNSFTTERQRYPSVAMNDNGDFVVAWESYGQDGSSYGIYAQRYNVAGVAQGEEFPVNTATAGTQRGAVVAADSNGDFVVVWQSLGQDGSGYGIYAQRYNVAGMAQGGEFRVNVNTVGHQQFPSVAMDADGDFVVAWESDGQDGSLYGIYARRYNAAGVAQGDEFLVNSTTADNQRFPSVAMNHAGDFIVAWESHDQDGSLYGVYAQRYNAAGVAQGGEFRTNSTTAGNQRFPSVAIDGRGEFVAAWEASGQLAGEEDVYSQRYGVDSAPALGVLSDSPDPVSPGQSISLTASGAGEGVTTVSRVRFYRESNGIGGLQFGVGGDTLVGTDTDGSNGWGITISTAGLAVTSYTYYAQPIADQGWRIGAPVTTTNRVGGPNPMAAQISVLEYQTQQAITITFNNALNPATVSPADLTALNLSNGSTPVAISVVLSANNFVATWVFNTPGTFISNGDYRFTLPPGSVSDIHGSALVSQHQLFGPTIFFLAADANRDRRVDVADLGILASNWLQVHPEFSEGNFDYSADGLVDVNDLGTLATYWQQGVGATIAPPVRSTPTKSPVAKRIATEVL